MHNNAYLSYIKPEEIIPQFYQLYPLPDGKDSIVDALRQRSISSVLVQNKHLRNRWIQYMDAGAEKRLDIPEELIEVYETYAIFHGKKSEHPIPLKMVHIFGNLFETYYKQSVQMGHPVLLSADIVSIFPHFVEEASSPSL